LPKLKKFFPLARSFPLHQEDASGGPHKGIKGEKEKHPQEKWSSLEKHLTLAGSHK
jgi:hypothetical protein